MDREQSDKIVLRTATILAVIAVIAFLVVVFCGIWLHVEKISLAKPGPEASTLEETEQAEPPGSWTD